MAYCFTSFILFLHSLGPKSESWSGMDESGHGPWKNDWKKWLDKMTSN